MSWRTSTAKVSKLETVHGERRYHLCELIESLSLSSSLALQVGCGAIGCELLKNYAMLGVARQPNGLVSPHLHLQM